MLYIKEEILINSDIIKLIRSNVSNVPHVFHISIVGNRRQVFVVDISVNDKRESDPTSNNVLLIAIIFY